MNETPSRPLLVVLGNQLFPLSHFEAQRNVPFFMAEDFGLCTYVRHHQQKIVLFLAAMRSFRDELEGAGFDVRYHELTDGSGAFLDRLAEVVESDLVDELRMFEVEDKAMEMALKGFAKERGLALTVLESPMFLCSRERFAGYLKGARRPFMADFYKAERRRLGLLLDDTGEPTGGRWSFDEDNRRKLPKNVEPPGVWPAAKTPHVSDVVALVQTHFSDHPGDATEFWWPTTREGALEWLEDFLKVRFAEFGPFEDAISTRSRTVFHSVLSPLMNLGLLTPDEVVSRAVEYAEQAEVPLQSVEGFVRQIIGWREFIRGVYQNFDDKQSTSNHFDHQRELTDDWYRGTTGIPPLDDTIRTALELGWTHHIPRLMVAANLMTLAEIHPQSAWRWFMEMYVDSSEWVMGPNVFGMGLFSDGGIFATKPYICGSNYLLKMSDFRKGEWCDVVDGLYWRFIYKHRAFFQSQPRLALMPRALDKLADERKERIFAAAEAFLGAHTKPYES